MGLHLLFSWTLLTVCRKNGGNAQHVQPVQCFFYLLCCWQWHWKAECPDERAAQVQLRLSMARQRIELFSSLLFPNLSINFNYFKINKI
jgi:hypothetical protein